MKFSEYLNEMAKSTEFSSGWLKSRDAVELVKSFKKGETTYELKDGTTFKFTKNIIGSKLEQGQTVLASYDGYNQGAQVYEIKGFTDSEDEKVNFKTMKDVFDKYKVKTLKSLEESADDLYMVVKDLESGEEGAWFYIYKGRWCTGSGADKLSFSLVEKM